MKDQELYEMINNEKEDFLKAYLDSLKAKLENLNSLNDKLGALLILTAVTYFLIRNSFISSVDIGPIELSNFDIGLIAIPLIFSFLLLYYAILNAHRSEVYRSSKIIAYFLLKKEIMSPDLEIHTPFLVRLFLPFSMWEDMMRMNKHGTNGCIPALMSIPLLGIVILPFWFQYYSVMHVITHHWDDGFYVQVSIVLTIWIILYTIFFYYKLFKINSSRKS